ncbi:MAG: hypothetical protein IH626_01385 [Rhodospirillales bacterium]|nr:hypothetical protein [Rhodospirillales bacterium]
MRKASFRSALMLSTFLVAGCQTAGVDGGPVTAAAEADPTAISLTAQTSAVKELVRAGTRALEDGKLEEASRLINLALKLDITNSDLQFFNGLTYHLMGTAGDSSKFDLAEQGYSRALKFDPGNLAARYQLGLLYMDQRRYSLAQGHFAAVALHRGDDPAVLYSLATASYYARDPKTAEAALKRLMEVAPEARERPNVLKARALALAAMDERGGAAEFVAAYRQAAADTRAIKRLERRVDSWQSFYDSDAKVLLAQYGANPYGSDSNPYGAQASPNAPGAPGAPSAVGIPQPDSGFADSSMVVVDVVLIGTQEDARNSRGINLLNGLQLQFGDPLTGTAGFGLTTTKTKDYLNSGLAQSTQTITRMISIPAVTYSLNIANSADANNQILAKPSLVAQAGQTSEFFSGTEILAAAVSGGNGDSVSVQKEVGVKLAVTPEILPDDMIRLHVVAERTFLTDPSNSVVFEFRLDTTKTNVNSTVTMKFGETLVLGGLSERETNKIADGVPLLMDIPIVSLLFSQRVEREFERSILILMTPRRPIYARQSVENRQKRIDELSDLERDVDRLEQRHKDWFTQRPTFNEIIGKLQGREFFEEFRTGDIQVQSWRNDPSVLEQFAMVRDRLLVN